MVVWVMGMERQKKYLAIQKAMEKAKKAWYLYLKMAHFTIQLLIPICKSLHAASWRGNRCNCRRSNRAVFEATGIHNVPARVLTTNPLNVVKATVKGLESMFYPAYVAAKRVKKQASYKMAKKSAKTIIVKQTRSLIGSTKKQISSMKGLGLRRINHEVTLSDTPEIRGMIKVVRHMIEISN